MYPHFFLPEEVTALHTPTMSLPLNQSSIPRPKNPSQCIYLHQVNSSLKSS